MKEYIFEISDKTTVDGGHPSVKREEICRCADCLHWKKVKYLTKPKGIGTICTMTLQPRDADDFCCFGIKKEWLPETTSEEEVVKFAPVRHGKWIWVEDVPLEDGQTEYDREAWYQCSECEAYDLRLKDSHANYCWSCGCKMDEVDDDDPHGYWEISYNDNIPYAFKCSECGETTIVEGKYCPNCGSPMYVE